MSEFCLFCAIAEGTVNADEVFAAEDVVAFRDIAPQAPVHVLVIPRRHYATATAAQEAEPALISRLVQVATDLAAELGVSQAGYRMLINTGQQGGQSVDHVHVHLLGGRQMGWPPG